MEAVPRRHRSNRDNLHVDWVELENKKSLKETRCGVFFLFFYQIRVNHSRGVAKELNVDIAQEC